MNQTEDQPTKRAKWPLVIRALSIGSVAALAAAGVALGRSWLRIAFIEGACDVSCHPAFMVALGWATLASLPPLIMLVLTRPPAGRRTKAVVYGAICLAAMGVLIFYPSRHDLQYLRLLQGTGPEGSFTTGVLAATAAAVASTFFLLATIGFTEMVNSIRRSRARDAIPIRVVLPIRASQLAVPLIGAAVVSALGALVVAELIRT